MAAAVAGSVIISHRSLAANATWSGGGGTGDTNWTDAPVTPDSNWVGGVAPGAVALVGGPYTNSDTAQFISTAVTGNNAVTTDPNRNIQNVIFGDPTPGTALTNTQFSFGAAGGTNNILYLTGGGSVTVEPNVNPAANDAINDPIVIEGSTYKFDDEANPLNLPTNPASAGIKFNGTITGNSTSPTMLTLAGLNYGTTAGQSGNCLLSGQISDGGVGDPLSITENDTTTTGIWTMSSATQNTFTGNITINGGVLRCTTATSVPLTCNITLNATTATSSQLRLSVPTTFATLTVNPGGTLGGSSGTDGVVLNGPNSGTGPGLTLEFVPGTTAVNVGSNPITLNGTVTDTDGVSVNNGGTTNTGPVTLGGPFNLGTVDRIFAIDSGSPSNSADLQLNGNVTGAGGSITKTGLGILKLNGTANSYTGGTKVTGGTLSLSTADTLASPTLTVATDPSSTTIAELKFDGTSTAPLPGPTVSATGNATLRGTIEFGASTAGILVRNLASVSIGTNGEVTVNAGTATGTSNNGNRNVLVTPSLTFADNTGKVDLTNNDLIVQGVGAKGATTVFNQIAQGRGAGGLWTSNGLTSSSAAASPSATALGMELNDNGKGTNTPITTTFDGVTVGDTDVLVKYTYVGDANLDGTLDASDYIAIDNGFNNHLTGWNNGDFNYDGVVNGDDYTLIDNAFNTQGAIGFAGISAGPANQIAGASSSAVPEPTTLGMLGIGGAGLLMRRRRRGR